MSSSIAKMNGTLATTATAATAATTTKQKPGGDFTPGDTPAKKSDQTTLHLLYDDDDDDNDDNVDDNVNGAYGKDCAISSKWDIPKNEILAIRDLELLAKRRMIGLDSEGMWGFSERRAAMVVDQHIVRISLTKTSLSMIPDSIQNIPRLQSLILSNNRIKTIPDTIVGLVALQELDLRNNNLIQLPDVFHQMPKLRTLTLQGNPRLEGLPLSLSMMSKPMNVVSDDHLRCSFENFIEPGELKALSDLGFWLESRFQFWWDSEVHPGIKVDDGGHVTHLSLKHQSLSVLPESVENLKHLQYLNLEDNKFETVPESLRTFNKTKEIKWHGNPMIVPGVDDQTQIDAIRELDRYFDSRPNYFTRTANPQPWSKTGILQIQHGNITHISFRMRGLLQLPEASLAKLPYLQFIDLDFNHLDHYPGVLMSLKNLRTVHVFGNRLPQDFVYSDDQAAFVDLVRLRKSRKR